MRHRVHDPELAKAILVARDLGFEMMSPLANSYNALGLNNQQPEYQCLWAPMGINPASAAAIVYPTAAGAGALVPGAVMSVLSSGVGSNPGPGGDNDGASSYTVATVDLAAVSATTLLAGILLGVSSPGGLLQAAPNTFAPSQTGPILTAMIGTKGICQVLVDNTTTIGDTLETSPTSTHTGQGHDTGGTTSTFGTTWGVALQAVTVSGAPKLCWAKVDFAYSV